MGKDAAAPNGRIKRAWRVIQNLRHHGRRFDVAGAAEQLRDAQLPQRCGDAVDGLLDEIARLRERCKRLEAMADADTIPLFADRRNFAREIDREIARVHRHGGATALLAIRIGNLSQIAERSGSAAADAALAHLAHLLRDRLRLEDSMGLLGDGEFGVLLVGADPVSAPVKAASLAAALTEQPLAWQRQPIRLAISIDCRMLLADDTPLVALDAASAI